MKDEASAFPKAPYHNRDQSSPHMERLLPPHTTPKDDDRLIYYDAEANNYQKVNISKFRGTQTGIPISDHFLRTSIVSMLRSVNPNDTIIGGDQNSFLKTSFANVALQESYRKNSLIERDEYQDSQKHIAVEVDDPTPTPGEGPTSGLDGEREILIL